MTCMGVYRPCVQPRRLHTVIDHGTNSLSGSAMLQRSDRSPSQHPGRSGPGLESTGSQSTVHFHDLHTMYRDVVRYVAVTSRCARELHIPGPLKVHNSSTLGHAHHRHTKYWARGESESATTIHKWRRLYYDTLNKDQSQHDISWPCQLSLLLVNCTFPDLVKVQHPQDTRSHIPQTKDWTMAGCATYSHKVL